MILQDQLPSLATIIQALVNQAAERLEAAAPGLDPDVVARETSALRMAELHAQHLAGTHFAGDANDLLVVDDSGTILPAHRCVLIRSSQLDGTEDFSDSEMAAAAKKDGLPLSAIALPGTACFRDLSALDQIALVLSGREWEPEDLERIAAILQATGRVIEEPIDG